VVVLGMKDGARRAVVASVVLDVLVGVPPTVAALMALLTVSSIAS